MQLSQLWSRLTQASRRAASGCIGLDLGVDRAHFVQLELLGAGLGVRAATSVPYDVSRDDTLSSPEEMRRLITRARDAAPLKGGRAVTVLPPGDVRLMVLNYRSETDFAEPEAQRILDLVAERVREPIEESVVDYLSIRTAGHEQGDKSALVAVARKERVIEHLERLRKAGLEVEALEIAPIAVRRLVASLPGRDFDENVLVVRFGERSSTLTVLWGRRLILYREVEGGESQIVDKLGKALELSGSAARELLRVYGVGAGGGSPNAPATASRSHEDTAIAATLSEVLKPRFDDLAEQVREAMVYTAFQTRGAPVHRVHLLGPPVRWPGVPRLFSQLLSLPVHILDPLEGFPGLSAESVQLDAALRPDLAIATGLALRGIADG